MVSPLSRRYQASLKRLRLARAEAGLTQKEVAKALRLRESAVSRFEPGERKIDLIEFEDLCRLYGKPGRYFLPELLV